MNDPGPPLRAALYIRVSSDEQAIRGLSLEAQQEDLERYTKEHGWTVAGTYIDAARTARKNIRKREAFQRMLQDVQAGKVDIILFTRLDRWFRNIGDYYKTAEILEKHHVNWKTTQEDYDTTTASGRLYINIKLSIAQNEADLTGERIAAVFDSKIRNGTVISGSVPFWLRINEGKRLELIPEMAEVARGMFDEYERTGSLYAVCRYLSARGVIRPVSAIRNHLLSNTLSYGVYQSRGRSRPDFAPAVISKEQFDRVRAILAKNVKHPPTGRVYLFTGLLRCWRCGGKLSSAYDPRCSRSYYRCSRRYQTGTCSNPASIPEPSIEEQLFQVIGPSLSAVRAEWELQEAERRKAPAPDRQSIQRKLSRLKELYVNDLIDMEEYRRDYEKYNSMLSELSISQPPPQRPDFEAIEKLLSSDFRTLYNSMSREEKRMVWRSILSSVTIGEDKKISHIDFL